MRQQKPAWLRADPSRFASPLIAARNWGVPLIARGTPTIRTPNKGPIQPYGRSSDHRHRPLLGCTRADRPYRLRTVPSPALPLPRWDPLPPFSRRWDPPHSHAPFIAGLESLSGCRRLFDSRRPSRERQPLPQVSDDQGRRTVADCRSSSGRPLAISEPSSRSSSSRR
jgi:hypothetical protein